VETTTPKGGDLAWWLGWRPAVTTSVSVFIAILLGLSTGYFGVYAAGTGAVIILVGLAAPWLRKLGVVLSFTVFLLFYLIGSEATEAFFESSGVGMDWVNPMASLIFAVGSLIGFEETNRPVEVISTSLAGLALWSLAGCVVGGLIWLVSVYRINSGYDEVYEDFVKTVERKGDQMLEEKGYSRSVSHGVETVPLINSAKAYYTTNLLIGESSISLHHGSELDMMKKEYNISDGTKDIFYDQVASVDYDEPYLRIRTSDGEVIRIVTSEEPREIIDRVQKKLQKYKTSTEEKSPETGEGESGIDTTPEATKKATSSKKRAKEERKEQNVETVGTDTEEHEDFGEEIVEEVDSILDDFGGSESVEESDSIGEMMTGVATDDSDEEEQGEKKKEKDGGNTEGEKQGTETDESTKSGDTDSDTNTNT